MFKALLIFAFFTFSNAAYAFWPFAESDEARQTRDRLEAARSQKEEYFKKNHIGRRRVYQYSEQALREDTAAGFRSIFVVDRSPTGQHLRVFVNGELQETLVVSTGLEGWKILPSGYDRTFASTPVGRFLPLAFLREHTSSRWNEKMPFTVLFTADGIAFHAASSKKALARLGHRASAGCVRLSLADAELVFELLRANAKSSLIIVEDTSVLRAPRPPMSFY